MDYAKDTLYMHLMVEGFNMWHQWNKEREQKGLTPVFHQSGVILFSQNGEFSEFEKDTMKSIREAGYGHYIEEFKSEQEIIERFPQFKNAVKNGFNKAYLNNAGGNTFFFFFSQKKDSHSFKAGVTHLKQLSISTKSVLNKGLTL